MTKKLPIPHNWIPDGFELESFWLEDPSEYRCEECGCPMAACDVAVIVATRLFRNDRQAQHQLMNKMRDEYLKWENAR